MQLTADIFGLPAARPHVYEASGLGAAIDASVGLGLYPDVRAAARAMTHVGRIFEPNPQTRAVYEQLYSRVYKPMYRNSSPSTKKSGRLRAIRSGWPSRRRPPA